MPKSFDDLMRSAGVTPLAGKGGRKVRPKAAPARKASPPKAAPAEASQPATPAKVAPALLSRPAPAEPRPAEPPAAEPVTPAPDAALEDEVRQLKQGLAAAVEARRVAELARDEAVARAEDLDARLALAQAEGTRMARALEKAGLEASAMPELATVLGNRGIKGADETAWLFTALARTRRLDELLRHLVPTDPDAIARLLAGRVVLHCGRETCPTPPHMAVVEVPPARCDACAGDDMTAAARHFVDACLVGGLLRVVVVGGAPRQHRLVEQIVTDARIQLSLVPGHFRTAEQALQDVARADAILLWTAGGLRPEVAALYPTEAPRLDRPDLAGMLEGAARALAGL